MKNYKFIVYVRIVNLLMIQHEAAKGTHNYWHVAANLIQADVASDT